MHNVHDCPPLRWRVNDGCKHQAKRHCSVFIYDDESAHRTAQTGSRPRLIVPLMAYDTDDVPDMYLAHASHEYLTSFLFSELVLVDASALSSDDYIPITFQHALCTARYANTACSHLFCVEGTMSSALECMHNQWREGGLQGLPSHLCARSVMTGEIVVKERKLAVVHSRA